jgi:hypothetical protein
MNCPSCKSDFEPSTAGMPTAGERAIALLKDWRVWAVAFVSSIVAGVIAGVFHVRGGAGAAGMVGIYVAIRLGRIRKCPKCSKTLYIDSPPTA